MWVKIIRIESHKHSGCSGVCGGFVLSPTNSFSANYISFKLTGFCCTWFNSYSALRLFFCDQRFVICKSSWIIWPLHSFATPLRLTKTLTFILWAYNTMSWIFAIIFFWCYWLCVSFLKSTKLILTAENADHH